MATLSVFWIGGLMLVWLGTHTNRSKRTYDPQKQPEITEQNITAQTPNPPKTETLLGLLALSALGKDDHVLEAMSMFPDVPSLPEL